MEASDPYEQSAALAVLWKRAVTPEVLALVERIEPLTPVARDVCACVRYQAPDVEALDAALQYLKDEDATWPSRMDRTLCALRAVGRWADKTPDRVLDGLLPYAFSYPAPPRDVVLEAFTRISVDSIPAALRPHLFDGISPPMGVRAALALGAERHSPEEVVDWLSHDGRGIRSSVTWHLLRSEATTAPWILARAYAAGSPHALLTTTIQTRQNERGDMARAFAQVAANPDRWGHERQRALEWLATHGDQSAIPWVEALAHGPDETVRDYAVATLAKLRQRYPNRHGS